MRKILSFILTVTMALTVLPAFAETAGTPSFWEKTGLSGLLDDLMKDSSEEGGSSVLSGLLDDLKSGLDSLKAGLGDMKSGLADLLKRLDGLKDKLGDIIPEKLSALLYTLKDALKSAVSRIRDNAAKIKELLSSLKKKISALLSPDGSESSGLSDLLGGILGGTGEGMSDEELAQWLEAYYSSPEYQDEMARNAAIEAYILDEYRDLLEAGDVQIVCIGSGIDDMKEDGTYQYLRNFSLTNYTVDGTALKMKNYANNVELLYLAKDADGTYRVTEAVQAEEGEKYEASIAAMSEKYGTEKETVVINLKRKESAELYQTANFLRQHDEYDRAEYQGQYKTADELEALGDAAFEEALSGIDLSGLSF